MQRHKPNRCKTKQDLEKSLNSKPVVEFLLSSYSVSWDTGLKPDVRERWEVFKVREKKKEKNRWQGEEGERGESKDIKEKYFPAVGTEVI